MASIMFNEPLKLKDVAPGDVILASLIVTSLNVTEEGITSIEADVEVDEVERKNRDALYKLRNSMDTAMSSKQPIPSP